MITLAGLVKKTKNHFLERKRNKISRTLPKYSKPLELAYFYTNGATSEQKEYVDWLLTKFPGRYEKEVRYFIDDFRKSNRECLESEKKTE